MNRWLALSTIAAATVAAVGASYDRSRGPEPIASAAAQHGPNSGPMQIQTELDNDSVRVLRIRMAPHETTDMHDVTPRLVVWLTDAHLRDTKPDGTANDYRRAAGTIEWVPAQRHKGENLSDQSIEFLAVLPKSMPSVSPAPQHQQRH